MSVSAAQALLTHLESIGVTAVICGGYARDTYCGKPIRDADVYVSEDDYRNAAINLFGDYNWAETDQKSDEYLHQNIVQQEEHNLRHELDFGMPTRRINLIAVNSSCRITVNDITEKYNLGICMIGIDRTGIVGSGQFDHDHRDKQITLRRTDWGYEATMKQFLKLQAKYPWPLRVAKQEDLF